MKMTEHTDKVELQKEKILKESLDQQVTAIDIRFGRIQTRYASGKVVTEYPRDKRKKTTRSIHAEDKHDLLEVISEGVPDEACIFK
jgi:S-adenosylmethionine hydrolase